MSNPMNPKPCILIAEIGCNHKGDMEIAKELINSAKIFCRITHVKFQKRTNRELLTPEQYNAPHPDPQSSYGKTYGEHREFLEFSLKQHRELKDYCDKNGMVYSTSVWDVTALKEISGLAPALIKIPSAINTNYELLEYACRNYKGEIHVSLGMTTRAEEREIMALFRRTKRNKDMVLYACTSGYPIEAQDACLLEITRLRQAYEKEVKGIGYSGHHNGIALDLGAVVLGATYIERHFTLNRTWKGTDHAASLEPDGLRRLEKSIEQMKQALKYKTSEILPIEEPQLAKLKWRPREAAKGRRHPKAADVA